MTNTKHTAQILQGVTHRWILYVQLYAFTAHLYRGLVLMNLGMLRYFLNFMIKIHLWLSVSLSYLRRKKQTKIKFLLSSSWDPKLLHYNTYKVSLMQQV